MKIDLSKAAALYAMALFMVQADQNSGWRMWALCFAAMFMAVVAIVEVPEKSNDRA